MGLRRSRRRDRATRDRQRLHDARRYLEKRVNKIRYDSLRRRDLVISTGIVEGATKHIIAHRCDHGGMRWIEERAQAVVQLRCIQNNGDWTPSSASSTTAYERPRGSRLTARSILASAAVRPSSSRVLMRPLSA